MTTSKYLDVQSTLLIALKMLSIEPIEDFAEMAESLASDDIRFLVDWNRHKTPLADPGYMAKLARSAARLCREASETRKDMGVAVTAAREGWRAKEKQSA